MSLRLLVADDEELERRALRHILGSLPDLDLEILEAANGRQAVEIAGEFQPDLALLDIRMPGMSGIEVAREFQRISPHTRCVFLTAFESFDYAREALRLGVDEYLLKPAEPDTVRDTVRRIAERIGAVRADRERRSREGADGERALGLLEEELRIALNRGSLDGERLYSFLSLRGIREGDRLAIVVRSASTGKLDAANPRATARKLAAVAERVLRQAGWFVISGSDEGEARLAAACVAGCTVDRPLAASVGALLDSIAERSLVDVGVRVRIGASPSFPADGPELFSAAQDAVVLASAERPVVILEPSAVEAAASTAGGSPLTDRAIEHIRSRLAEDLSLSDVAAAVSCSPFHLSRLFRLQAGDTFVRVFTRMRVDAAKALLRTGGYSVKEVGAMVGFNDQTYFARVFKKLEGVSPAEYKAADRG